MGYLVNDKDGDPIIRNSAGRIAADYPTTQHDLFWLAEHMAADDKKMITALSHICGTLAIRFEDEKEVIALPWVYLVATLTPRAHKVVETLRFLLYPLIKRVTDKPLCNILGTASRAAFSYALALNEPDCFVRSTILPVTDTINTDVQASCHLLEQLISSERLQRFDSGEIPVLCCNIKKIGDCTPEFVVNVFEFVYAHNVIEEREATLGENLILPLRSSTRQNCESARYSFGEHFFRSLEQYLSLAVDTAVCAISGYVARRHPLDTPVMHVPVPGHDIYLKTDCSYIWAHDLDSKYAHDGGVLVRKLFQHLQSKPEPGAFVPARLICEKASLAILRARIFLAANRRNDGLIDFLWPVAAQEALVQNEDTRKDAIDLVAMGITYRSEHERRELENSAFQYDFSDYVYLEKAKTSLLYRLFSTISSRNLQTIQARNFPKNAPRNGETSGNKRLLNIPPVTVSTDKSYDFIDGLDRNEPDNITLISAVRTAKTALGLTTNSTPSSELSLEDVFSILKPLHEQLDLACTHTYVHTTTENVIVRICAAAVEQKLLPPLDDDQADELTSHFLDLVHLASCATGPILNEDTGENLESSVSWDPPAPRINATQIILDITPLHPGLYERLKPDIERMLIDPHLTVRLQTSARLLRLWDVDRSSLWRYLSERLEQETNTGIIKHTVGDGIGNLLHTEPARSFYLIQKLLGRFSGHPECQKRIRTLVSSDLAILWGVHEVRESCHILQGWISEPTFYHDELNQVLFTLGEGFVLGPAGQGKLKDTEVRHRALNMAYNVINAADKKLEQYSPHTDLTEIERENATHYFAIIDRAYLQLRFVCEGENNSDKASLEYEELKQFLNETELHMRRIGDYSSPHTAYYFLELLETLIPVDPAKCFDLMAYTLSHVKRSGLRSETLGIEQLIKMMGVLLVDHKTIFEDENRQARLIESLDIFLAAGWSAARRLLYRLPELIR